MSKSKSSSKAKPSMFSVSGRLFLTRDAALAYCKANRIPAWRMEPCPFIIDTAKVALAEDWRLSVFFEGSLVVLICSNADRSHAFKVRFTDLVELSSAVKVRSRKLSSVPA